jgi:hypothetical protein
MNNPMQAEGAAWGSDTVNGERPTEKQTNKKAAAQFLSSRFASLLNPIYLLCSFFFGATLRVVHTANCIRFTVTTPFCVDHTTTPFLLQCGRLMGKAVKAVGVISL